MSRVFNIRVLIRPYIPVTDERTDDRRVENDHKDRERTDERTNTENSRRLL